jgi:rhodanese-related sulfurtransferase
MVLAIRFAGSLAKETWRREGGRRKQGQVSKCALGAPFRGGRKVPQKITASVKSMVEAAKREIEELPAAEAVKLFGRDVVVLVDLRDPRERERDGTVPGTFNVTRGMLEFWIDPDSPYYKPRFGEDKKFVFFCAGGLRSALAAKTAQDMGLKPVAHVLGGFRGWKEAGGPVEPGEEKK